MVAFLQWFAFWAFAILLSVPWLFCVYQLITNTLGKTRRIKAVLDEGSAPKVVIVMPVYNEIPEVLLTAIDSIVDGDYPPTCQHIFLSFDGADENELYLKTIESLGVPLSLESYPSSLDVTYRGMRITVSRFPHGGKRHCQKKTFRLIDRVYTEYLKRNDNLFILFIDSDCILDKVCIQNFVYEMVSCLSCSLYKHQSLTNRIGVKTGKRSEYACNDRGYYINCKEADINYLTPRHGVYPWTIVRAVC